MTDSLGGAALADSAILFAFRFEADGTARRVAITRDLDAAALAQPEGGFVWLHLTLADRRGKELLSTLAMPLDACQTMTEQDDRNLLDRDAGWVFGRIADHGREFEAASEDEVQLRFAAGPGLVVTARRYSVQSVYRLRRDIERGRRIESPLDLVEALFDNVASDVDGRRESEEDALARIEARLLRDRNADVVTELGSARRELTEVGRQVGGLLAPLRRLEAAAARFEGIDHPMREMTARLVQRFDEIARDVRADSERARLLQDEAAASANILANRHLFVLTVLNSLLLPATLVTGFFGMNTGGMLWNSDEHGTLKALGLCIIAAGAAALYMRRRGMFR